MVLLAKGKIAGNHSKVKENIGYCAIMVAIHLLRKDLLDSAACDRSAEQAIYLLLPLYIVFLRTKMPACVVETS